MISNSPKPSADSAMPQTWRAKLFKVAATLVQTTRRILIHISNSWPFWPELSAVSQRALRAQAASP